MASRTVDISNAPRNTPSAGGNRLFSAQTPDTREGLPYVEYRADAKSPHAAIPGASSSGADPFRPPSPLDSYPLAERDKGNDREPPEEEPEPAEPGQSQGNGWQYNATVVTPGPAYGGAAYNGGGGSLAHAITFGDARPLGGGTMPKAIESGAGKVISGVAEDVG